MDSGSANRIGLMLLAVPAACVSAVALLLVVDGAPRSAFYVPCGLFLLAVLCCLVRGTWRAKLAVLLFFSAPLPWVTEAAAGWLNRSQQARLDEARRQYSQTRGVTFDGRASRQVVEDLRRQGRDAWPAVHPATLLRADGRRMLGAPKEIRSHELRPLAGISNVETVYGNEQGSYLIYRSDQHGFHNPPDIWSLSQIDVAAVGDSFTHGASVQSDENLVAVVRQRWPATLNLGYGGNGPLLELAALLEYLPQRRPRVVLWVVCEVNDLGEDLTRELNSPLLLRYWREGRPLQNLERRQLEIDALLREHVEEIRLGGDARNTAEWSPALKFLGLERLRQAAYSVMSRPSDRWDVFSEVLRTARDTVRAWDGTLYLVYLPVHYTVRENSLVRSQRGTPEQRRQRIADIGQTLGVDIIDLEPVFAQAGERLDEFLYPYPGHFTAGGYEAIGRAIVERLESDGW